MTLNDLLDALESLTSPVSVQVIKEKLLAPFGGLPAIEIPDDLQFGIPGEVPSGEFDDGDILSLDLVAADAENWELIAGIFSISSLSIAFKWTVVGDTTVEQTVEFTEGKFEGSFEVAGETIALSYDLTSPADGALSGTFPTIDLASLFAEYFPDVTLPADFPTFNFSDLPVTVNPVDLSFTFNGATATPWTLVGDTITLADVALNVAGKLEADNSVTLTGDLSGALNFASSGAVRIGFAFGDTYKLTTEVETLELGEIVSALIEDITDIDIPDGLPDVLSFKEVNIEIDQENNQYAVASQSDEDWVIIENLFTVGQPALSFQVSIDENDEAQIEGGLTGLINLAEVNFEVGFDFTSDSFDVRGGLVEGQTLSFFKLAEDVIDGEINLPEDFDVTFSNLALDISPVDNENSAYTFSGNSEVNWDLIPDVIGIDDIALDLTVTTTNDTAEVSGSLAGNFAIGNKTAVIAYGFDSAGEDFKLNATLPELSFADIIDGLLTAQGVSVPDNIPDFSFSDIDFEILPDEGKYSLKSTGAGVTWDILPGLFSLANVGVDFSATKPENTDITFAGGIHGTLQLGADVAIGMSFLFSSEGYRVDGSIETLNLSSLAEGLLEAANFEVDLPDFDIAGQDVDGESLIGLSILPDDLEFSLAGSVGNQNTISFYGIDVALPDATFTIDIKQNADAADTDAQGTDAPWVLSFVLTIQDGESLNVSSKLAWMRELGGDTLRELQNDPDNADALVNFSLAAETEGEDIQITILQTTLGDAASTIFLEGFESDDWNPTFDFNTDQFTFPFLNQSSGDGAGNAADVGGAPVPTAQPAALAMAVSDSAAGGNDANAANEDDSGSALSQNITIEKPNLDDILFTGGEIGMPVRMFITIGTVVLESGINLFFNISKMAFRVEHSGGIEILSDEEELNGGEPNEIFGLEWRFFGEKKDNGRFHHFTLVTKDFNYQLQQASGARIEIAYTKASKDPIKFGITDFALTSKGLTVTADVLDDPARLNGVDTKFRFAGSQLKIVENRIQDFTLSGSGPLPPDLVGDAMVDISMQFQQQAGALTLVAGAAKLRGNKILDAKSTRFQLSIDAIGLKFVNDGQFHLFFTLTGTARFVLASGDDKAGALAMLPTIQIDLHECPLTGDASVIAKHVSFLIELPKPVSFPMFGAYEFELRAIGFLPNFEVFDAAAMQITGQVKFAQGAGDTANNEPDFHSLYIALPEPGSFIPRLYMDRLPLSIQMGEAFKLDGVLEFLNSDLEKGFAGEGVLEIKGLPPIAASFAFLRVRKRETDPFVRAWFIFIELRQVSFRVPVLEFYIREIGLGFGYRYTLVAIKAADEANDLGQLISELKVLSRTAGDLSKRDRWAVDIEEPGKDLRWTIVLRAMISQLSAATSPLTWNAANEEKLANAFLFDAVIAFRSDLTFFMNVRGWINTSYGEFVKERNDGNNLEPLLSGFVFLWPRQKRFLAHLASNPNGHLGSNPPLPSFVEDAVRNGQFSATLLIEPNLMHFEMGWPNMLRWSNKIGPLNAEMRGGFIFRISNKELVMGISYTARANLKVEAGIDLGLVGASLRATADASLGARFIGVIEFANNKPTVYGAIGLELNIRVDINLWIKIPLLFKTIKLSYTLTFRLNFTAGLELGFDGLTNAGLRGSGSISVSAMGHRLHFSAKFSANGDVVTAAKKTTERFLNIGLEATEVEAVPGIEQNVGSSAAGGTVGGTTVGGTVGGTTDQPTLARMAATVADTFVGTEALALEAVDHQFDTPNYRVFVVRENKRVDDDFVYFSLLPRGENDVLDSSESRPGFLPVPPDDDLDVSQDAALTDFRLEFPVAPDATIEQFDPFDQAWDSIGTEAGDTAFSWKANWDAIIIKEVEEFSSKAGEESKPAEVDEQDFKEGMTLRSYLRTAYITNAFDETGSEESEEEATVWLPVSDPMQFLEGASVEDQRVHNPSDNAFEAAVRGAQEQFSGSPFFKRDPNLAYDQALEVAFQEDRTVYTPSGYTPRVAYAGALALMSTVLQSKLIATGAELIWNDEAFTDEEYNALKSLADPAAAEGSFSRAVADLILLIDDMAKQKQAIQVRSLVINELIQDVCSFADATDEERMDISDTSISLRMGLVFRVRKDEVPAWLSVDQSPEAPALFQRNTTSALSPNEDPLSVSTFNVDLTDFGTNPPQFQRVRHYTDAGTVAIAWDLNQSFPEDAVLTEAQRNPEHNLMHYDVRRLPLDGRGREVVYQIKAASALCPADGASEGGAFTVDLLKPRFQVVDHFTEQSAADLAALPTEGRSYLYTITPVDYAGKAGHPLTLVATRFPNEPPRVPVDGELRVEYTLNEQNVEVQEASVEAASTPELIIPTSVNVSWTEPVDQRDGPRVAIKDYFLVFRKETTLPIGNYGLDSATSRPRSKQLPTSNARTLRSDIKISITSDEVDGRAKDATISIEALRNAGILPKDPEGPQHWRPESWRVFFQTVSAQDVPSPLSPVELVIRVRADVPDAFEERRPAELEWLPRPIQMAMLPPEDQRGITGLAHFPMPQGDFLFGASSLENGSAVEYNIHPAELRAIRFRWNQGPSSQPDYPLDLTAGYELLQLDTDAHTTDTFNDPTRLSGALSKVQEIQMISADDLLLTPGDTLSTQAWEAWYPSTMRRLLSPDQRIEGSESLFAPWFSWRESILEWPEWPGLTGTSGSVRNDQLHPFLRNIAGQFRGDLVLEYDAPAAVLDAAQILDAVRVATEANGGALPPNDTFKFVELQAGIEFRFIHAENPLSFSARLEEGKVRIFMEYQATLQTSPPIQPGDLTALINGTPAGPDPYGWGILQRFGLSATLMLQNKDGDFVAGDELINAMRFVIFLNPDLALYRKHVFVEQLYQRGRSVSLEEGATDNDALLGIIQMSLRPVILPKRAYTQITIRRTDTSENTQGEADDDVAAELSFSHPSPFSVINQSDSAAGQTEIEPELDEDGLLVPVKRTFDLPLNGTTNILIRSRMIEGQDPVQVVLVNADQGLEIEENSFLATDDLATYFTVPLDSLVTDIATSSTEESTQWLRLKRYAESLNSTDPAIPDDQKINVPASGEALEKQLPEILSWLQRFMDVTGDVVAADNAGPWIATAYPKSGTPAHATPDESGRLTYNHLVRDGWAHNYRYYLRPNDRYGLLWDSFLQSVDLFDDAADRKREPAPPDVDAGGLDVVIERINPVDRPVILRSARLDPPMKPGVPAKPGRTWEVIVGQHREQSLMEKNQTLARQLAYRQIAFTLLRRQTFNAWVTQLEAISGDAPRIELIRIENQYPDTPASYPEQPAHIDFNADTIDESDLRDIELPERIGTFQQGALVLQWKALPFYYEHRLMLIAQTATTVSKINRTTQRDFEYVSPDPDASITYIGNDDPDILDERFRINIELKRFWDSLPVHAQEQWPGEAPEVTAGTSHQRTLSSLPDPEVVYQIIEIFNGNLEIQFEVFFDNALENFAVRQLGERILGGIGDLRLPTISVPEFYHLEVLAIADPVKQNREAVLNPENVRIVARRGGAAPSNLTDLEELITS